MMKSNYQPTFSDIERKKKQDIGNWIIELMSVNAFSYGYISAESGLSQNDIADARFGTLSLEQTDKLVKVLIPLAEEQVERNQRALEELRELTK